MKEHHEMPYIPDKRLYAAVMGACNWIRKDGYFNKAVSYYAKKYGVGEDELAKEIRKRQACGQKNKSGTGFHYKKYRVKRYCASDANPEPNLIEEYIIKAKTLKNAQDRVNEVDEKKTIRYDYGSSYSPYFWSDVEEIKGDDK